MDKKNYPPGQHGNARRRGKKSEYAMQLAEKQKAKYTYGLLEKQFYRTFEIAAAKKGITGENLLKFLEFWSCLLILQHWWIQILKMRCL